MFIFNAFALLVVYAFFVPLRLISRLSERLLEAPRDSGWDSSFGDQLRLSFAHGAALRQAQLYTAYPTPAYRVMQLLRLLGVR
ncbi:hypothetical protein [Sphingomonas sp. 3-13AW]|uniref:hypothetical protein n=1 Tax=Sphingomonas sp. 3-13AW TaxID=3050450 RepID=UPI003BB4FE86